MLEEKIIDVNPAIELQGISKNYDSFQLDDVSMIVPKGYITGLIGPNGAGKSTIIKMIMGMVVPDQGEIKMNGKRYTSDTGAFKEKIGYVSDENIFYDYLTLNQIIKMTAPFYKRWNDESLRQMMKMFQLPGNKKIKDCSKGMKMKFSIALAMARDPQILILDEPTAGLDPVFRRELLDLFSEYILDESRSILFSTHNTVDLDRIADYVTFINGGHVVFSDIKDEVIDHYVVIKGSTDLLDADIRNEFVGLREVAHGFEGLSPDRNRAVDLFGDRVLYERPTLEDIMYFTSKGEKRFEKSEAIHN
ncbi:ABC transporter ATP-binding protein [Paenibacillus sp. N3/727]|uniref:ABC transporter ATP-binding protein n=1 Tax=Paenibacillus sp. N3/727 TaxID=2925845 RepID=UPI001F53D8AF|nr:ABC transporter ATP-binding protein [Paenibacillus sp. N3/727]UNK16587.1 ABC transporter ATP-binding protein [Paenibacillus sp. N3/727]